MADVAVTGGVALAAVLGALAGAAGAVLLARIGLVVPLWWCSIGVAVLSAVGGAASPPWWWAPVPFVTGWLAMLLTITDLVRRRLPDVLTLPAYPVAAVLLVVATYGSGDGGVVTRGLSGAVLWAGGYAAVRLVAAGSLGGGDVKLAGSLGAMTAAVSWSGLLLAVLVATVLTAVVAAVAAPFGQRDIPHGPAMLGAAWLVVMLSVLT